MEDGYIDVSTKKTRFFCKKHRVLVAGQCPFCREDLKKKIGKYKNYDCLRNKLKYKMMRADPVLNEKLQRQWKENWAKQKEDMECKERRRKYAQKYYKKNKEQVIKRNNEAYHLKTQDPEWMRARAEKTRLYRLKNKV